MDNVDKYLTSADRGYVFEFLESDGTSNKHALVVSSQERAMDRIINILMVGDSPSGFDVVDVKYDGKKRYVHCGLVTYCSRERLGRRICKVSEQTMSKITICIARQLGCESQGMFYKSAYDSLVEKLVQKESNL